MTKRKAPHFTEQPPTWADARAKVHQQRRGCWTHDDPDGRCAAPRGHYSWATAVGCERSSQLACWRRRRDASARLVAHGV